MSKREKNLREFLISTVAGAFVAAVLCAVLPEIERGLEMITFFLAFWFLGIYGTWTVIDIRDRAKQDDYKSIFRHHIGGIIRNFVAHDSGLGIKRRRLGGDA